MEINKKIKTRLLIVIVLIALSSVFVLLTVLDDGFRRYDNDIYKITYEKNWKVTKKGKDSTLTHKSGCEYVVKVIDLSDEFRRSPLDELIDDILEQVEKDNPNYKLVNKEKTNIGKDAYEAYQFLYETDDFQSMITICKRNDRAYIINYIASIDKFDIILDSVKDMNYKFEILI